MNGSSADRGQSNPLGIAIVLVLALTTALLITGVGSLSLEQGRQVAETQSGIRTMSELDSRASFVALDGGDATTLDVDNRAGGGRVSVQQRGQIRFVFQYASNGTNIWGPKNYSLGTVVYENGDSRVAYQGGGVWRRNTAANGSVMVSPPEVNYEGGTLTLPMINISGANDTITTASIRKTGEERVYPIPSQGRNFRNPVREDAELVMFVQSEYYRAWGDFFEQRIGANVTVYPGNETVRVKLVSPSSLFAVDAGLISVGTASPIDMQGSGGSPTFVDSYNSSSDPYPTSKNNNGVVRSPSGVEMGGNTYVNGTINTSGPLEFSGNSNTVNGSGGGGAFHDGVVNPQNGVIIGANETNGSGVNIPPITNETNNRVNAICDGSNTTLANPTSDTTINGGTYCRNGDLDINGDTLTIKLTGNVTLAVKGDIKLNNDAQIRVTNVDPGETATIWLGGSKVTVRSSQVLVEGDKSPALRLFGPATTKVTINGGGPGSLPPTFTGLLYAPSTPAAGGELSMKSNASLYGAAITGNIRLQSGTSIHFDEALGGFTFSSGTSVTRLDYLHITIHEVEIKDR